jgi:hypothetical protein
MRIIKRKFFPDRIATVGFGRDRIFFWVATRGRSRLTQENFGRDLDRVEVPNTRKKLLKIILKK